MPTIKVMTNNKYLYCDMKNLANTRWASRNKFSKQILKIQSGIF
jgi:hypothetical protein